MTRQQFHDLVGRYYSKNHPVRGISPLQAWAIEDAVAAELATYSPSDQRKLTRLWPSTIRELLAAHAARHEIAPAPLDTTAPPG